MTHTEANTADLQVMLNEAADGNVAMYDDVVAITSPRLLRLTRKMLSHYQHVRRWEQTDDVFQNAVVRLYRSLRVVQPESVRNYFGLAVTQIRRTLIDLARHYYGPQGVGAQHQSQHDSDRTEAIHAISNEPDRASKPETLDAWAGFHEAVGQIGEEEREVFQLVWYGGLKQQDVADMLNVSLPTVKRRLHRARRELCRILEGELPGEEKK